MNDSEKVSGHSGAEPASTGHTHPAQPPKKPETSAAPRDAKGSTNAMDARMRRNSPALNWQLGAALLLTLGLGTAGYFLWTGQQALNNDIAQTSTVLRVLNDTIKSELKGLNELRAEQQALRTFTQEMRSNMEKSHDFSTASDAEYLMRIASHRLLLEQDVSTAITALEEANQRLGKAADSALLETRQQLIDEITQLKAVPQPDIAGASLTLNSLQNQVERWTPLGSQTKAPTASLPRETKNFWSGAWEELKSLVVIKRTDQAVLPLTNPDQRFFLRHNLRLALETARLALLRRDTKALHTSLSTARDWLARYFEQDAATKAAQDAIAQLEKMELAPPLPDISPSLNALHAWLARNGATTHPATPAVPSGTQGASPP